jgi:hypothetical protein
VCKVKAKGYDEAEDAFDKGLAIAKELQGGGCVVNIDGDGPVCAGLARDVVHGAPQVR